VDPQMLIRYLLVIATLYAANRVILSLSGVIILRVSQKLVYTLRKEVFEKMQQLPLEFAVLIIIS